MKNPTAMIRMLLAGLMLMLPLVLRAQTAVCWPNSRGDAALTGKTSIAFPQKIKLKWKYDAEGIFKSAPVICDGRIVVGSTSGDLLCLDLKGQLLWSFKSSNSIEAPALIVRNTVYVGNLSGTLYALDLKTGTKKWEYSTENQIMSAPALHATSNKEIVAVGSYDFFLHGVDSKTGRGLWKYESENFLNGSPATANGKAVFGGCDGFLHVVDLLTGQAISKIQVASYIASSPAIVNGVAFVGDYDGNLSAIDLKTSKTLWQYKNADSPQPFIASPAISGNRLIIGSRDKMVYCIDITSGKLFWKQNSGYRIEAPAVVNATQALVINLRGDLILLNLSDGKLVWTYEMGTNVLNTPAVIQNGIVVAASDGNIYFFSPGQ